MNALTSPRPNKYKRDQVKTSPPNNLPKRSRNSFLPLTIPGTPDAPVQTNPPLQQGSSSLSARSPEYTPNDEETDDELTYLDLYYKVFNKHRLEPGESNAEAAARHQSIEDEYQELKNKNKLQRRNHTNTTHELTPSKHSNSSVQFQCMSGYLSPTLLPYNFAPIIEPLSPSLIHEPISLAQNTVQEISTHTDYSLYSNPDKPLSPRPIGVIYDTGVAISMMPAQYTFAWTNLRECLHTLTGCFSGQAESNLQIGEIQAKHAE